MSNQRTTPITFTYDQPIGPESMLQYPRPIGPKNDIGTRVQSHIERFVAFNNPHHSRVMSLWALHTHVFDAFKITPYVYVSSIDPGAGKTTLMKVVQGLVRDPELTGSISPAGLYRRLVDTTPTIILDEVDTIYSGAKNEDLRGVLNTGYDSSGKVTRFINGESVSFPTYCPKLLGGIDNGQVPETVMDRCLRIRLRKVDADTLAAAGVEEYDFEELEDEGTLEALQVMLGEWGTVDTATEIKAIKVERIEGLSARQWQLIRPLLKIASYLGTEDEAREALTAIFRGEVVETDETRVLRTARELFADMDSDRLPTAALAQATGFPVRQLSRMLSPLGIESKVLSFQGDKQRGYMRPQFEQAWARFL